MNAGASNSGISERVTALETSVEILVDDVGEIREALGRVATKNEITIVAQDVRALTTQLQSKSQTQWSILIPLFGLILSIIIAVGALAYMPIQQAQARNDERVTALETRERDAMLDELSRLRDTLGEILQ